MTKMNGIYVNDPVELDSRIQNMLLKFISEEVIAYELLHASLKLMDKRFVHCIDKIFTEIAQDEIEDHCRNLIEYAKNNGYKIPAKFKDYQKHSDKNLYKIYDSLKENQEPLYYVQAAIKAEILALDSYTNGIKYKDIPYDLNSLILKISFDEQQHLSKLQTLKTACEANAYLSWV